MSFPRYPAYKDSGVEWLGEVPEHWDVIRLKNVLRCRITDGPHTTPEFIEEGIPFLSVDGIQDGELRFEGCRYISAEDHEEFSRKASPARDDILMGKAASTGKIARVKTDLVFSIWSPLALIRVENQLSSPSYYEQFLKSISSQAQIDVLCTANTQKNISMDDIPSLVVARPPHEEQREIATFLDRETAKIDALIAEQQRLIELLQEKRQAVISHAVTKGLNPDAPMKDSGVEWLGEVPEHWRVLRGNYVGSVFGSEQIPEEKVNQEGDIPFIKVSTLSENCFEPLEPVWFVARADIRAGRGRKGFLVFPKRGAAIFGNKVNIIKVESLIDPNLMGWLISDNGAPAFYAYTLKSKKLEEIADVSTVPQINTKHIAQELWPCPPLIEQFEIIAFLDDQAAMFDSLVKETNSSIALLQERRSALISAAVTGQIDVRGLAPETSAA